MCFKRQLRVGRAGAFGVRGANGRGCLRLLPLRHVTPVFFPTYLFFFLQTFFLFVCIEFGRHLDNLG